MEKMVTVGVVWEEGKQSTADLKVGLGCSDSVGCGR